MSKPIWAGLNGYSAEFARSEIPGCEVFLPGNLSDAMDKFYALDLKVHSRQKFNQKFSREKIMKEMVLDILNIASKNPQNFSGDKRKI